ncbi:hypothetical protein R3W88_017063 [Solanum pinnatisectum]|uniref:Endonuclease/exonuclease/phosphatase domain-containing protein n=1 Tax=Solanum pinnatisectum TaxID=50273 RepID=A0AAV9L1G9_9SOLN|nr:hypothetical protein R3W88_017063 [Solanum pinnatisectum]
MIGKIIFWNIRSVNTQKSFERLINLNKRYHYVFLALMEPFQDPSELDHFRRKLGFDTVGVNCSGKILYFWRSEWEGINILDTVQQVTIRFKIDNKFFLISAVYARCNALERLELWAELESITDRDRWPWIIGGYFNVILNE